MSYHHMSPPLIDVVAMKTMEYAMFKWIYNLWYNYLAE